MSRVSKTTGRIAFVGAGPGGAGMLTVRAQHLLSCAELLVVDPDVPADVAKDLVAEAKSGRAVVRLVSGDPLTADAVVAEAQAVARSAVPFDVVPGVPA